ncbi:MAG TPA: PAS domain S-box protein [Chitinophagaceae bacterium]|nr:PAS domain S-box protein [Chitinophagaceae bacterium]
MPELRASGIDVLGEIPWGSHFCNFYETKQDLLDMLVPYFKAGLENKEFCLWVVSNPGLITAEEAKEALTQVFPGVTQYLIDQKIEILNGPDWYLEETIFDSESVMSTLHAKLERALALGYDGMRAAGDTFWLNEKYHQDFSTYEKQLNKITSGLPIIVLCTYPLEKSGATEILDVVHAHQFAIARRQGEWEVIESPELTQAKAEIKKLNEELEERVVERTRELESANNELRNEIAERKKAELLIIREKELSNEIIDSIPGVFMILDENLRFIRWNKNTELVSGYTASQLLTLHAVNDFFDETDDRKTLQSLMEEAFEKGAIHAEASPHMKDGRKLSFYFNARLINYEGKRCIICTAIDITERKQAEDALRQNEDRIRLIIDTIPIMAWAFRPDGTVDYANQRWLDYAGVDAFEEPNRIIHPEDFPAAMEKWLEHMITAKAYEDEMRLRRADGEYRWFLVRSAPAHDELGNLVKWYGVCIDIHDSKQAEDELRLAYQGLSYHVENSPLAVIELDKDLFVKRWSNRAEEIFGWKASEALGKNVYDPSFPIIYIEDVPEVDKINEQLMKGIVDRNLSRNRNYTKDGNIIYCEWYNSVLRDEHGDVITILSLVLNVTERKKTEDTLQQSYEEIRRLTEHLQKIREEERRYIAREIHDELGQQLTAIKMDVAWIDKKMPDESIDIKRKLKNIISLLDGSNQSIRRILSELRPRILDDHGLLEGIEWLGQQFAETTGIPVKLTVPEKDIIVSEQIATCIFRVCQEALTNITRHSHAKKVSNSITIVEKSIVLVIEDDGTGFDIESVQTTTSFGILGMKERVLSLGGKFELVSSPGKGTKITASLPYRDK